MLKVAMIGAGHVSRAHRLGWLKLSNAKVIGVSSRDPERARAAAADVGAQRWTTDYNELLRWDDVDAVDICTTEYSHAPIAIDAAEYGKHILVEKPMTSTVEDADRLLEATSRNGVSLMVAHTHRFYDYSQAAKTIIESGEIGTPVYLRNCSTEGYWKQDWTGTMADTSKTGSNILHSAVHIIDLFNWWLGVRPVSIYAQGRDLTSSQLSGVYDYSLITIKYENGAIAVTERSQANHPRSSKFRSITILGTQGEIQSGTTLGAQWSYGEDGLSMIESGNQHAFSDVIREFTTSLEEGRPPMVTGEQARRAVAMCEAARRSIEAGEAIDLSHDT